MCLFLICFTATEKSKQNAGQDYLNVQLRTLNNEVFRVAAVRTRYESGRKHPLADNSYVAQKPRRRAAT
jgi:hypothetical protein